MRRLVALATIVWCLSSVPAGARTLYVDAASGSDTVSYAANSAGQPWKTIGRAAWGSASYTSPDPGQAARAGDVVLISAGIYWEDGDPRGGRFAVHLNPINSGTAESPITFKGNGLVFVRMNRGFRGAMIGCAGRDHIVWDTVQIDDYYGGSTSDTGPVVFHDCDHCQIVNSDVKGHPGSYYHGYPTFGGNYRGISLEPANHTLVRNNRIHNFTGGQNEAGVMAYDSNDTVIENNEIYDNGQGVFIKGVHAGKTQARNIIRDNFVHDNWSGIRVLGGEDTLVYRNVVTTSAETGVWLGFADSTRSRIVNNTLYNNDRGIVPQGKDLVDVLVCNNIVADNGSAIFNWDSSPSQQQVAYDRNVYFRNGRHAQFAAGDISFGSWRSVHGHDRNGSTANPRFVDAARGDFRLRRDSAARTLGVDVLDLNHNGNTTDIVPAGAYLTGSEVIGLTPPRSPR